MHIKSYYANRVETAMEMASRELGDEAVFIQSKHTTGAAMAFGKFEVVFGIATSAPAVQPVPLPDEEPEDDLLLRAVAAVADSVPIANSAAARTRLIPAFAPERPQAAIPEKYQFQPGPVAFIGHSGAGKTTAVMKFAFTLAAVRNCKVRIAEVQDPATGSSPQLRRFAEILNIPLISRRYLTREDVLDSPPSEFVLIDAPGFAPSVSRESDPLLRLFGQIRRSQCHLVVPAWYSPAAVPSLLVQAHPFGPTHLLVTHAQDGPADSVRSLEAAFRLPLSLMTAGREPQRGFLNLPHSARGAKAERAA